MNIVGRLLDATAISMGVLSFAITLLCVISDRGVSDSSILFAAGGLAMTAWQITMMSTREKKEK